MATLDEQYANIVNQYSGANPQTPTDLSPLDQQYADAVAQYTQPTAVEQKQFNLAEKAKAKQERLGHTKRTDSLAYEYQDLLNGVKSGINTLLPESMELNKYEVGEDNKLYILDEDTNKRLAAGYFGKDKDGNEVFKGEGGNDGDTYSGIRMQNIDTPESVFDDGDDSKFKRVTDRYGISYDEQLSAGTIAKKAGAEYLAANPDTQATMVGKDFYGRDLASSDGYESFMIANGYAVPSENASADYVKAYEDAKANKLGLHGSHPDVLEALSIDARAYQNSKTGGHEDTMEWVDAFQAGAVGLAGRVTKAFGEASTSVANKFRDVKVEGDGAIEKLGKRLQEEANEIAGYNPSTLEAGTFKLQKAMRSAMDGKPDIGLYLSGLVDVAPQVAAGSLPDIAAFAGAAAAGTAASGGNAYVGWMAGMATMGSVNANDSLDEREKLNGGKKASAQEFAAVFAAESVASALDYGAFKFVTGGKVLYKGSTKAIPMEEAFKITSHQGKAELALALSKSVGRSGAAFGAEAVQEGTTEAIRILAKELGTEPHEGETLIQALERNAMNIATAASLGGSGGATMGAGANVNTTGKDINRVVKRAQAKSTAESAGANASSLDDAENKQFFSDQDVQAAKTEYTDLTTIHDSISEATSVAEIEKALEEAPTTKLDDSLDGNTPESKLDQMRELLKSDVPLDTIKEAITGDIRNYMEIVATEGRNKQTSSDSLGKAIDSGELITEGTPSEEAFTSSVESLKSIENAPYRSTVLGTIRNVFSADNTPKATRRKLKAKLGSISNKALDTLVDSKEAIQAISDAFKVEGSDKSAVPVSFIEKAVKDRIAKRVKSDTNLNVGIKANSKEGTTTEEDIQDSIADSKIAANKANKANKKAAITGLSDSDVSEAIELSKEANIDLLTKLSTASREAQDKLVNNLSGSQLQAEADSISKGNKKLSGLVVKALRAMKKNTSVQGRKSFVVGQARSSTADLTDLEYGLKEVEKLKSEGHINQKEYDALVRNYAAVKERSEAAKADEEVKATENADIIAKEEAATKAKATEEAIEADETLTDKEKATLKDMPEWLRTSLEADGIDPEALENLDGLDPEIKQQLEDAIITIMKCKKG